MTMGERGLSPAELLAALIDGPPTEGDVQMIMELRVGLLAEGSSGPARVAECDVPEPVDPELTEWLHHRRRSGCRGISRAGGRRWTTPAPRTGDG